MGDDLIQAQYEQLERIAGRFSAQATLSTALYGQVERSVQKLQNSEWKGQGAAAFNAEVNSILFPAIRRLTSALEKAQAVILEISRLLQAAEDEAAKPFRGNAEVLLANDTDGSPSSPLAMQIPAGGLPPRPAPPPPPSSGDGSATHGSVDRNWFERRLDDATEAAFALVADAADAKGLDNAARHMRHYLGNSGKELAVPPEGMLRDLPGFREQANRNFEQDLLPTVNERVKNEFVGQPMRFQVTTDWKGYYATKGDSQDWFYAVGGFSFAQGADVIVTPNPDGSPHVDVQHQLHVFDRYNWDQGKGVDIAGIRIGDEQLGHLHEIGAAQEYEVRGKSTAHRYTYDYSPGSSGPAQPWGEGTLTVEDADRSTREGREESRSPRGMIQRATTTADAVAAGNGKETQMELARVQEWAGFTMPEDAKALQFYADEAMDNLALMRFQLPADEIPALLAALGFTKSLRQNYFPFPSQLPDAPDWWRPGQAQTFVGGAIIIPGLSRELLIEQSAPDLSTLFLRTYEVG